MTKVTTETDGDFDQDNINWNDDDKDNDDNSDIWPTYCFSLAQVRLNYLP